MGSFAARFEISGAVIEGEMGASGKNLPNPPSVVSSTQSCPIALITSPECSIDPVATLYRFVELVCDSRCDPHFGQK